MAAKITTKIEFCPSYEMKMRWTVGRGRTKVFTGDPFAY